MRMNWNGENPKTFEHINIKPLSTKVLVWVITKDFQSVVIEDDPSLYPSDTLITQLRMLEKA